MDDPGVTPSPDGEPVDPPVTDPEAPPRERPGMGRSAALVALGVAAGVAVAWLLWGGADGPGSAGDQADGANQVHGIDVTGDPVMGPDDAPVTIVEFSDFECPYCARFATRTAPLLRRQYGDRIRWIFVNSPLRSIHPGAYDAAVAGECATAQEAFWPYYDAMFSGRFDASDEGLRAAAADVGLDMERFETCFRNADPAPEVAADEREAQKFYVLGTPTFFINGQRLEGAQPPEAFATVIDSILAGT